jgi:hypothetical protein
MTIEMIVDGKRDREKASERENNIYAVAPVRLSYIIFSHLRRR